MNPFLIMLTLLFNSFNVSAQTSVTVENGYLVVRIKLDENIDTDRLSELLNSKSTTEFSEIDEILLTYQDFYRLTGQNLPDWIYKFRENLRLIDRLNKVSYKPETIGNLSLRYDPFSKQITQIGDMRIGYEPFSKKISQVGDIRLKYDGISGKIIQIGSLKIEYDPFTHIIKKLDDTNR